jgi:TolB-like protein/Tfp pilus assembly protein PilF
MAFVEELKRRNVFRVAIGYVFSSWLLAQVADLALGNFGAPDWVMKTIIMVLLLGFPVVLFFSWAYEVTPEGIKRESEVDRSQSITQLTGRKYDRAIVAVLIISLAYFAFDKFVLDPARDAELVEATTRVVTEQPPAEAAATAATDKSIAVLPFANRSANAADMFFVDGLHDDLLTHIAKIGSIKVISRTSVMPFRDTDKSLPEIAQELGVATILEGGVQRAGDSIRVNVQLIDAVSDEHLWAEIYDRQLTTSNIFTIQSEIATAIAATLRATLTPAEKERIQRVPTENMAALEAYFKGRQSLVARTSAGFTDAFEHFQQAIALDPDFALAYVGLADTYAIQGPTTGIEPQEQAAKVEAVLEQAFALDDTLGEAYAVLGLVKYHYRKDYAGAEIAFKRALELSPNYAFAHHWYGQLLLFNLGRPDEAVIQFQQALELEPLAPSIRAVLGFALLHVGQVEEGLAHAERVVELSPTYAMGHITLGAIRSAIFNELDQGVRWASQAVSLDSGDPDNTTFLGLLYLDLGDVARAEYWLKQSIAIGTARTSPNVGMALLHTYRGEDEQALEYANRAAQIFPLDVGDPEYHQAALSLVRNAKLKAGRAAEARTLYQTHYPRLLNDDGAAINRNNVISAINLALVLTRTGEQDRADDLLDRSPAIVQGTHWFGLYPGSGILDVQVYALQNKSDAALAALRQAIDKGWRMFWWYHAEHDPNLDSIRDEPEFQAMMDEIRADMAVQLERVREMERNGELAAVPEISVAE